MCSVAMREEAMVIEAKDEALRATTKQYLDT